MPVPPAFRLIRINDGITLLEGLNGKPVTGLAGQFQPGKRRKRLKKRGDKQAFQQRSRHPVKVKLQQMKAELQL